MQDLETLEGKTIVELREIAKVLGITDEKLTAGIEIKLPYIEAVKTTKREIKLWN